MNKTTAAALMLDALAERALLTEEMSRLTERMAGNDAKLEVSCRLMAATRDVEPARALGALVGSPESFLAIAPGRVAFGDRWTVQVFLEAASKTVVRLACRAELGSDTAVALLDHLDAIAAFEGGALTGATVPYTGGTYRTGLIGYMLLRPWEASPVAFSASAHPPGAGINLVTGYLNNGDCRALLNFVADNSMAPDGWLAPLAARLLDRVPEIDTQSRDGITLVAMAARNDWSLEVIGTLLERGANPFLRDLQGDDAVRHARDAGRDEVVEMMLLHGRRIDPEAVETWRETIRSADGPRLG